MIVIEKNIPMPEFRAAQKYPFKNMEVGDSLFFEGQSTTDSPCVAVRAYAYRSGKKFMCRAVEDGVRIWRTS